MQIYVGSNDQEMDKFIEKTGNKELQGEWEKIKAWDDYDTYLVVVYNNGDYLLESDRMEPEDVKFYRDLSWIPATIEKAYEVGFAAGVAKYGKILDMEEGE